MKAITKFRRRMKRLEGKLNCDKCPVPKKECDSLAIFLWGEPKCLLKHMMLEIFVFRADTLDKGDIRELGV